TWLICRVTLPDLLSGGKRGIEAIFLQKLFHLMQPQHGTHRTRNLLGACFESGVFLWCSTRLEPHASLWRQRVLQANGKRALLQRIGDPAEFQARPVLHHQDFDIVTEISSDGEDVAID